MALRYKKYKKLPFRFLAKSLTIPPFFVTTKKMLELKLYVNF